MLPPITANLFPPPASRIVLYRRMLPNPRDFSAAPASQPPLGREGRQVPTRTLDLSSGCRSWRGACGPLQCWDSMTGSSSEYSRGLDKWVLSFLRIDICMLA